MTLAAEEKWKAEERKAEERAVAGGEKEGTRSRE